MPKKKRKDDSAFGENDRLEKKLQNMGVMYNQLLEKNRFLMRRNSGLEIELEKRLKVE